MGIIRYAKRKVVTVTPMDTVAEAARRMRDANVGCLIVVVEDKPVGILTDRDITVGVVSADVLPSSVAVEDVMVRHPIYAREDAGVYQTILNMKEKGIKRMPIVGTHGELVGIVTADDLVRWLAIEMADVAAISSRQVVRAAESPGERYI